MIFLLKSDLYTKSKVIYLTYKNLEQYGYKVNLKKNYCWMSKEKPFYFDL